MRRSKRGFARPNRVRKIDLHISKDNSSLRFSLSPPSNPSHAGAPHSSKTHNIEKPTLQRRQSMKETKKAK